MTAKRVMMILPMIALALALNVYDVQAYEGAETKGSRWFCSEVPMDEYSQKVLYELCESYGVPLPIALGVIEQESGFDPDAENEFGDCFGLMQINEINAEMLEEALGITDIKEPDQNMESGIFILSELYEEYSDWNMVLVCYNCGESGAYRNYFSKGIYKSAYSKSVLEKADNWKEVLDEYGIR